MTQTPLDDMRTQKFDKLVETRMPFGKYKGRLLLDLPEPYLLWFKNKGFPAGQLGEMMAIVFEVKLNGLDYLFKPLKKTSNTANNC